MSPRVNLFYLNTRLPAASDFVVVLVPRLAPFLGAELIAALLIVVLADHGWTLETVPGKHAALSRGDQIILPFEVVLGWFESAGDITTPWTHQLAISDNKDLRV